MAGLGDYSGNLVSVGFGAGFGLSPASDSFAIKLMLIRDLTGEHSLFRKHQKLPVTAMTWASPGILDDKSTLL